MSVAFFLKGIFTIIVGFLLVALIGALFQIIKEILEFLFWKICGFLWNSIKFIFKTIIKALGCAWGFFIDKIKDKKATKA